MKTKLAILLMFPLTLGVMVRTTMAQARPEGNPAVASPSLSAAQLEAIKSVRAESGKKVAPLALRLASVAKRIYENMLSEREDATLRRNLRRELDKVTLQLLAIKGQSIREIVGVLTPAQRKLVKSKFREPGAAADLSELVMRVFNVPKK